jgi:hypothetical protein
MSEIASTETQALQNNSYSQSAADLQGAVSASNQRNFQFDEALVNTGNELILPEEGEITVEFQPNPDITVVPYSGPTNMGLDQFTAGRAGPDAPYVSLKNTGNPTEGVEGSGDDLRVNPAFNEVAVYGDTEELHRDLRGDASVLVPLGTLGETFGDGENAPNLSVTPHVAAGNPRSWRFEEPDIRPGVGATLKFDGDDVDIYARGTVYPDHTTGVVSLGLGQDNNWAVQPEAYVGINNAQFTNGRENVDQQFFSFGGKLTIPMSENSRAFAYADVTNSNYNQYDTQELTAGIGFENETINIRAGYTEETNSGQRQQAVFIMGEHHF